MENCYKSPKNICHFEGFLFNYTFSIVGDGHPMGRGELRLKESDGNLYQTIPIVAWYDVAERLSEVTEGTWVKVLSSYSENTFAGRSYTQFIISSFSLV